MIVTMMWCMVAGIGPDSNGDRGGIGGELVNG